MLGRFWAGFGVYFASGVYWWLGENWGGGGGGAAWHVLVVGYCCSFVAGWTGFGHVVQGGDMGFWPTRCW